MSNMLINYKILHPPVSVSNTVVKTANILQQASNVTRQQCRSKRTLS